MFWVKALAVCSVSILGIETSNYFTLNRNDIFGLSLLYFEHVLRPDDVHITYPVKSYCQCQNLCRVDPSCLTASVARRGDGSLTCMVSREAINDVSLKPSSEGVTFARNNADYFLGDDGVFYSEFQTGLTVPNARTKCEAAFKHGRLMMPKTKAQWKSVRDFRIQINLLKDNNYFLLDLEWNMDKTDAVWGDGTLYSESEIAKEQPLTPKENTLYFVAASYNRVQHIRGVPETSQSWIICEMNPLGSP